MEIPPTSSIAQASAYFTGFSEDEQRRRVLEIVPEPFANRHLESLNIEAAASSSSLETEFRQKEFIEAYRLYNGSLLYPFQSVADIFNHKFDPSYFDGSEGTDGNFNVQENLIGTPLGASELIDPRVAYLDSLMKIKEYTAGNMPLDDKYIKNLYMLTTEKGANYYMNQLDDLKEAMGSYSRESSIKNRTQLSDFYFENKVHRGVHQHDSIINSVKLPHQSSTPNVQYNYRREDMKRPYYTPPVQATVQATEEPAPTPTPAPATVPSVERTSVVGKEPTVSVHALSGQHPSNTQSKELTVGQSGHKKSITSDVVETLANVGTLVAREVAGAKFGSLLDDAFGWGKGVGQAIVHASLPNGRVGFSPDGEMINYNDMKKGISSERLIEEATKQIKMDFQKVKDWVNYFASDHNVMKNQPTIGDPSLGSDLLSSKASEEQAKYWEDWASLESKTFGQSSKKYRDPPTYENGRLNKNINLKSKNKELGKRKR